jgi:hypothetical protein
VTPGIRFALLNRDGQPSNPALSKYQVLKKISEFNHANNSLPANKRFKYIDNYEMVERNKELDHHTGLYLSGLLSYSEPGKNNVEVFLLDTSDYKDAPDWASLAKWGFYGAIGSLSFKDEPDMLSQTSYFKKIAGFSSPDFRFLASHYPKDHLDRITFSKPGDVPLDVTNLAWEATETAFSLPTFTERLNKNLDSLLSPGRRNYWLSGHTHAPTAPKPAKVGVGGLLGERHYCGINTGSTTDYRAHVLVVERYERQKNSRMDSFVGYREIPLFDYREDLLAQILKSIGEYGGKHYSDPNFQPLLTPISDWIKEEQSVDLIDASLSTLSQEPGNLLDRGFSTIGLKPKDAMAPLPEERYWIHVGATILGLNKGYRASTWNEKQTQAAEKHLRDFIEPLVAHKGNNRDDVVSCLAFLAGAYESGKFPKGCDFRASYLKKLCDDPK